MQIIMVRGDDDKFTYCLQADLETRLVDTQDALANEKQTTATLQMALNSCNEDKAQLEEEKAALIDVSNSLPVVLYSHPNTYLKLKSRD